MEAVETMKAYIAHNMNENEELQVGLETTRSEVIVAQKLAKEGVYLLRKAKEEKCPKPRLVDWLRKRWLWRSKRRRLKRRLSS